MNDLETALTKLFRQAYEQGIEDGRQANDHRFIERKYMHDEFGIPVDSFDGSVRGKDGFPSYKFGTKVVYYIPAVHKWLMDHQQFNN